MGLTRAQIVERRLRAAERSGGVSSVTILRVKQVIRRKNVIAVATKPGE